MADQDNHESFLDKVKETVSHIVGSDEKEAAVQEPEEVGRRMSLDPEEREDIGMDVPEVGQNPYAGSADEISLETTEEDIPGKKKPPDSALW